MMKSLARHIIESDGITKTAAPGDIASSVAAFLRKSPVMMPALGGLAGAGMMTPYALKSFKEGRTLEGIGQLGTGAVLGTGTGLLGRTAMRGAATIKDQAKLIEELQALGKKNPSLFQKMSDSLKRFGSKVHNVVAPEKKPLTRIEKLMRPKNTFAAGGAVLGAGLASAEAERSIEEGDKYKGITQLGIGALLGGMGGRVAGNAYSSPLARLARM